MLRFLRMSGVRRTVKTPTAWTSLVTKPLLRILPLKAESSSSCSVKILRIINALAGIFENFLLVQPQLLQRFYRPDVQNSVHHIHHTMPRMMHNNILLCLHGLLFRHDQQRLFIRKLYRSFDNHLIQSGGLPVPLPPRINCSDIPVLLSYLTSVFHIHILTFLRRDFHASDTRIFVSGSDSF